MSEPLDAQTVFQALKPALELSWIGGTAGTKRPLAQAEPDTFAGRLNWIHPTQIQVLGAEEFRFLDSLEATTRGLLLEHLFSSQTGVVIVGEESRQDQGLRSAADRADIPLWSTPASPAVVLNQLQKYYHRLDHSQLFHGELLEIFGLGVLLSGASSIGKSELALELVSRGHRLVADDTVILTRVAPNVIEGICPDNTRDFLEVRGLGILNIRRMFGDSAIKRNKRVRLIIMLVRQDALVLSDEHRLQGVRETQLILAVELPSLTLPIAPGRNFAVLVECAVRDHIQRLGGYHADQDLAQRLQMETAGTLPCE